MYCGSPTHALHFTKYKIVSQSIPHRYILRYALQDYCPLEYIIAYQDIIIIGLIV